MNLLRLPEGFATHVVYCQRNEQFHAARKLLAAHEPLHPEARLSFHCGNERDSVAVELQWPGEGFWSELYGRSTMTLCV